MEGKGDWKTRVEMSVDFLRNALVASSLLQPVSAVYCTSAEATISLHDACWQNQLR